MTDNYREWQCPPDLWEKHKLLAQHMRQNPTPAEKLLWQALRRKQRAGFRFRQQHAINRFIVDFYCAEAKLIIEVDGASHEGQSDYDAARTAILETLGLRVLRFTNEEVLGNLEGVVMMIEEHLPEK